MNKAKLIGSAFVDGVKYQLKQEWLWGAAAFIGLSQGLKYKGDFITGLKGGLATLGVISGANGIYNIIIKLGQQ